MNVTLFNPNIGFFGRTYKGKQIPIIIDQQKQEANLADIDWTMFYTQIQAIETKAIVEVIVIQTNQDKKKKSFGVGFAILPIFFEDKPESVEIYKGTPRDIMKMSDPNQNHVKSGSLLYFDVSIEEKLFDKLSPLIPDNCLIGVNDDLPGVSGSRLPQKPNEIDSQCEISKFNTLYAHNIRISSMNEVESAFDQFLNQMNNSNADTQFQSTEIVERKLSVVPHNSWQQIGTQSFVSLNKQLNGVIQSSGALKILNFLLHPMVSLIFKLEYRVKCVSNSGKSEIKDFIIGWCMHIPTLSAMNEDIKDEEVQIDMILGPGSTLLGDVLWDQTVVRQQKQLQFLFVLLNDSFVKMAVMLTGSEDVVSASEKQKEQFQKEKQFNNNEIESKLKEEEYQKLTQIQQENEKLRREKEELERLKDKPSEEALQQTFENKEIENAKEYYTNKNDEVEQLIQSVLQANKEGQETNLPQHIVDQGEQSVASLLRFLIQIVMQNYGPEDHNMNKDTRQEVTKKNLIEMLKGDQNYKMNVFGTQGGMSMLQSRELSRQDKINIYGHFQLAFVDIDSETEAKLISSEPRMDIEVADPYKASTITFKFVAFKTGVYFNKEVQIPQKLYVTFKFFTFKTVESEKVVLKLPNEQEKQQAANQSQINSFQKIKPDTQYYLVKLSTLQQSSGQELSQSALEAGMKLVFDIDPSISKVEDENLHLSRYLKDRVLTIDLWNGDSLMHFATCKVSLHQIMRQGEPSKVIGQEYDVCEAEYGQQVGGLQLLITNEGRKIESEEQNFEKSQYSTQKFGRQQPSQSHQKHKKKVLSKPIENVSANYDGQLSSLAQQYEVEKKNLSQTFQSEEARKRLRVERLKKQSAVTGQGIIDLNDPSANEWQKMQTLKQLELFRETKKSQLLNTVLKETMQYKQKLDVTPGQVQLIHFLTQNPFAQDDVFDIVIEDPDEGVLTQPELILVHNEQQEWQYWFNESRCSKPSDWDIVSSKKKVILASGQQCPLLLKFISYREPVSEGNLVHNKHQPSPIELRPRKIKISLMSKERMPIGNMEIQINPREQICDQIFRFYEPQNTRAYIKIPQFVPFSLQGMNIISSNKEVKADIDQNDEAYILLQTNRAPYFTESYLYIYQDQYYSQLLGCCKVEIYAFACIREKLQAGVETVYQLQVKSQMKRTIEIFSSNNRLVFPPGKKERNVQILQPNEFTNINIAIKPVGSDTQRARIHCVDINTKELIQSWLLEIQADKPQLQKAYQVETVVGRHTPYKFPFSNPLPESSTFELMSSKPTIMHLRREKESFNANESKDIDLYFPPQQKSGQLEVILFINEESGKFSQSILFKVFVKE